ANTDDSSCIAVVSGCIDATAFNYDASANTDDSSCIAVVSGCIDATAFNYDSSANTDDSSCVAVVNGCTDATAFNYDSSANTNDGSCEAVVEGCMEVSAFNYNSSANTDDGSCEAEVAGCTNPVACNYNSAANVNDDYCLIIPEENVCDRCSGETDGTGTIIVNSVDPEGGCLNIDEAETKGIQIYPNPSRDLISISNVDYETVTIYSLSGQMLQLNKNHDGQINISTLSSGIYTLKITDADGNQYYSKLIKK
ncbi:MAG: T9SS type A sorting domain-containing protein, partial [Flavobacteriales bacterium]|nr:T9SS type A sorting domain-containing protein [Flavobacteriales bacterium]